jgi:hypothetical protein
LSSIAKAGTNFLLSLVLIIVSIGGFILVGSTIGYWNPGIIGMIFGVGGIGLFLLSKLPRFAVVAAVGIIGGLVATVLGPTADLGLKVAVTTAVGCTLILFWKILAQVAD